MNLSPFLHSNIWKCLRLMVLRQNKLSLSRLQRCNPKHILGLPLRGQKIKLIWLNLSSLREPLQLRLHALLTLDSPQTKLWIVNLLLAMGTNLQQIINSMQ